MNEKNYGEYTKEEVARSLQVIQGICLEQYDCDEKCSFINKDKECNIKLEAPEDWNLNGFLKAWTPFK